MSSDKDEEGREDQHSIVQRIEGGDGSIQNEMADCKGQ